MDKKNVLTIATGKAVYLNMAINLARSFYYWNKENDIDFYLATDQSELVPQDLEDYLNIIQLDKEQLGIGISTKLRLDKIAPIGQTLFIDSDCLIYGDINHVFNLFKGHTVSVIGNHIATGDWFGDVAKICKQFNIEKMPKFNGGIYYLENGDLAKKIYDTAREIERSYDEIGFVRLKNQPNDEVIMAVAMALNDQKPIIEDGTIMSDPQACQGYFKSNIITGFKKLINPKPPHILHQNWYPFIEVSPLIIHYLGYYTQKHHYLMDEYRLKLQANNQLNSYKLFIGKLTITYPARYKIFTKNILRPLYSKLFGYRAIKNDR